MSLASMHHELPNNELPWLRPIEFGVEKAARFGVIGGRRGHEQDALRIYFGVQTSFGQGVEVPVGGHERVSVSL